MPFIELSRQAHPDRSIWINADHIALISEEHGGHARLRLCDAMVVDVDESAEEVVMFVLRARAEGAADQVQA